MAYTPNRSAKVKDIATHIMLSPDLADIEFMHQEQTAAQRPATPSQRRADYIQHGVSRYGGLLTLALGLYIATEKPAQHLAQSAHIDQIVNSYNHNLLFGIGASLTAITLIAGSVAETYRKRREIKNKCPNGLSL